MFRCAVSFSLCALADDTDSLFSVRATDDMYRCKVNDDVIRNVECNIDLLMIRDNVFQLSSDVFSLISGLYGGTSFLVCTGLFQCVSLCFCVLLFLMYTLCMILYLINKIGTSSFFLLFLLVVFIYFLSFFLLHFC